MNLRRLITVCVLLSCAIFAGTVRAQASSPAAAADSLHRLLFNAQSELMGGNTDDAITHLTKAREQYIDFLRPTFDEVEPTLTALLDTNFDDALSAAGEGDNLALAIARGNIWTAILHGSTLTVEDALETGDAVTAKAWVLLREFRVATRFSRPGADSTLALQQLAKGNLSTSDALAAVRSDFLDTYQAQLMLALASADEAHSRGFTMRRAEEIGLAAGYFEILASAYGEQNDDAKLDTVHEAFAAVVSAAANNDATSYEAARTEIDTLLMGFRAAPLSEKEMARRAGQLVRFISLVPVEYERGVRDGKVINDIEIQEALTFLDGATAAYTDLQGNLSKRDAEATLQVDALFDVVRQQIRSTADPAELDAKVNEIETILGTLLPEEWTAVNASAADGDVIISVLEQMETAAAQGQYNLAESARLEAYALLELGMEQRLNGFAPDMAILIESLFWQGTPDQPGLAVLIANNASRTEIRQNLTALKVAINDAQVILNAAKASPTVVIGNAAIIVFREGLEAVLILASLLASLRTLEERKYRKPLLTGAALALVATGVTWWFAHKLLALMLPLGERLEAIVSLIAIGVLLLITNWFFHKVYWTGWLANFHSQKRRLIGGLAVVTVSQSVGLILLGFASIYREGFETVLFLQSLVLEAGISVVLEGVALGLVGVAIVGFITFSLQVRLPYKKMLIATGIMIGGVLLIMVGNTVHVMQSVGWLPITPIQGVFVPYWMSQWLGIFATWQGVILQFAAAAFVIGSYFLAEAQTHKKRSQAGKRHESPQASELNSI